MLYNGDLQFPKNKWNENIFKQNYDPLIKKERKIDNRE